MQTMLRRLLPLLILIIGLILFFYFHLDRYLSFKYLHDHRAMLLGWTQNNYLAAVSGFMGIYILAVAISVPGAVLLTLAGGFLFGSFWGTLYVVVSATIGAVIVFFAVHSALNDWLTQKAAHWMVKMRQGFSKNAFYYLLFLRLVPIFPFWVVNIVPGLLNVKPKTYILATFLGIIPGSLIYVMVGNSLGYLFDNGEQPNLGIILSPQFLLPLIGLGLLALLPVLFHLRHKDKN